MREEDVAHLRAHWLFAGVPADTLTPLVASSRIVRFLPGEEVFSEGDNADGLYFIIQGTIRVVARGGTGRSLLATLSANDVFGEMGVLDGEPRSGLAIAISVCTLFFLPSEPFLDLLENSSLICNRLLLLLAQRLRNINTRLADLPTPALMESSAPDLA